MKSPIVILSVLVLAGCSTLDKSPVTRATAAQPQDGDPYPLWTRATSWLLTPLTGASGTVEF